MPARITMTLSSRARIDYRKGSNLQGVMFEQIDRDYAAMLHRQSAHPYSQYLYVCRDKPPIWVVNALNGEAVREIIGPLSDDRFRSFTFQRGKPADVKIVGKNVEILDDDEILRRLYTMPVWREVTLHFLTPTAFKQRGMYNILPDIRLIFQSLMLRYRDCVDNLFEVNEDMLDAMVQETFISSYMLHSVRQPLEGVSIPGFEGRVRLRFREKNESTRFLQHLLEFGTFSGVGVKTGMGMGGLYVEPGKDW